MSDLASGNSREVRHIEEKPALSTLPVETHTRVEYIQQYEMRFAHAYIGQEITER